MSNNNSDPPVFKTKTPRARLSITGSADTLQLRSGNDALQSTINLEEPHKLALKNLEYLMGVLLFIPAPENILILGTGGGCLIHFLRHHYPQCRLISVDFDAELQKLMHEKMHLPEAGDQLTYVIDDAAHYLDHCDQQFDLILVDLFNGNQSPDWLLDLPSMRQIKTLLSDQGAVAYNLLIDSERACQLFRRKLAQLYAGQALFLSVEGYDNNLAYGLRYRPRQPDMRWYMQQAAAMSLAHDIDYNQVLAAIYAENPVGSGIL